MDARCAKSCQNAHVVRSRFLVSNSVIILLETTARVKPRSSGGSFCPVAVIS